MNSWLALASLGTTLVFAACGGGDDAPSPSEVRARIASDLGHVLTEGGGSLAAGESAVPNTAVLGALTGLLPSTTISGARTTHATGLTAKLHAVEHALARVGLVMADDTTTDPLGSDAAVQWLNENVFTNANSLGNGIYQIPPALVCTETTYDDTTGVETQAVNPDCATKFLASQLRIRVAANGDTLDFSVQLGADRDEPLSIGLAHSKLSLTVDLDAAIAAATALAPVFGTELPNLSLSGQVTAALEVLGTQHAKATLTIDRAIAIKAGDAGIDLDGPDAFRFSSAAAQALAFEYDGVADTGAAALAVGATAAYLPASHEQLDLPGVTATVALGGTSGLQITNLSLGDHTTTLKIDGTTALSIDLNPNDGRKLAVSVTGDATTGTLAMTPKLDLNIAQNHTALGTEREVYDVTRVLLDGSLQGSDSSSSVKVLTGTFAITTDPAQYGFSAATAQCVSSTDVLDDASGYYYTQWTAGACL